MVDSMTTATGQRPKSAQSTQSLLSRMSKAEFRKVVAERMLEARELNGYTQTEAALKMGYKNPTQLSLWEMNRRMPPLQKLLLASHVYLVSMDFLTGVSPEPDRDPMSAERRQVLRAAQEMCEGMSSALADAVILQTKVGGPTVQASYAIVGEGDRFVGAVKRFIELNSPKFDGMRGGATLKHFLESFEANGLAIAHEQIARYGRLNAAAVKSVQRRLTPIDAKTTPLFDTFND